MKSQKFELKSSWTFQILLYSKNKFMKIEKIPKNFCAIALTSKYKNYQIYRQSEKQLHIKDKNWPFLPKRQPILVLIQHYRETNLGGKITRLKTHCTLLHDKVGKKKILKKTQYDFYINCVMEKRWHARRKINPGRKIIRGGKEKRQQKTKFQLYKYIYRE